ncbi:Uncharacterized protein PBTT_02848 [Plasmodiophora brassicae]|uniref:Uncharacterized protein n=1 Tax=Plasmodiophora brassicae TaxID=37360 RepID=A0A0G4J7F0_PLABS|nr:hypothetical protein PBRA_003213 [Plasmodiophora brassicae]SPQ95683.1 unnamed protein product [Plasmodiophora brassicae]
MEMLAVVLIGVAFALGAAEGDGGACLGPKDADATSQHEKMQELTAKCGGKCRGNEHCTTVCMEREAGLSKPCAECYGQDAQCTKKNCFIQCMIDQMSRSCLECSYEHCHEAFAECSGVTPIPPKSSARRDLGVPVASHEHARKAAE